MNIKKRAKQVSTFDFSTLYTKIPHNKLIEILTNTVEFCFKGCTRSFIDIDNNGKAHWRTTKGKHIYSFSKDLIIHSIKYVIQHCYFQIGTTIFLQTIGVPMGGDPAPFWENLFLFYYEHGWLKEMKKSNNILARKFGNTFRFIDDLLAINDGGEFEKYHKDIYPEELILKKENTVNTKCSFLDLDIEINNRVITTKLYDKRDSYNFSIVKLPYKISNIPVKMFLSSVGAEILRIARVTSSLETLQLSVMIMITKHWVYYVKYNHTKKNLLSILFN